AKSKLESCRLLLAIQKTHNSEPSWRVVMQIKQTADSSVSGGVELLLRKTSDVKLMECTENVGNVAITKGHDNSYEYGMRQFHFEKDKLMMCAFNIKPSGHSWNFDMADLLKVKYKDGGGNDKLSDLNAVNVVSSLTPLIACNLNFITFSRAEARTAKPGYDFEVLDTSKPEMKCRAGYNLIVKDIMGAYKDVDNMKCSSKLEYFTNGGSLGSRAEEFNAFCAKPGCCTDDPPCVSGATCAKVDRNSNNADTCPTAKCEQGVIKAGSGTPTCSWNAATNKMEWTIGGSTDFTCISLTPCPDSNSLKFKDPNRANRTKDEAYCKEKYEMSYKDSADNKYIVLTKIACDHSNGAWTQIRKNPVETRQFDPANELICDADGDPAPAAANISLYIGAGLGALVLIIVVALLIFCCFCKKNRKESAAKKHQLTKPGMSTENKSKESKSKNGSKDSKSNVPSSSGVHGAGISSDHSVTQKDKKKKDDDGGQKDPTLMALDSEHGAVLTALPIGPQEPSSGVKTGMPDENRSNPTERSAIAKTDALNDMEKKRKAAAMLESSKVQGGEEGDEEGTERGQSRLDTALAKGSGTRNLDPTQAQTKPTKYSRTRMKTAGTQNGSTQDPTRGPDGTQQP
ncbi:hypothetical protein PFISCL1PPCAC_5267, partial [Pristionchus fissidentatus]